MPVELRKRKEAPPPPPPAKKRAPSKSKDKKDAPAKPSKAAAAKAPENAVVAEDAPVAAPEAKTEAKGGAPKVGDTISLEGFGGEIEDNEGKKVTLAKLVEESKAGVVLFTYPKASTPGCTSLPPSMHVIAC